MRRNMANKVLVVDDEKLIVKGLKFSLEQDGMQVECAYDGAEALECLSRGTLELIYFAMRMAAGELLCQEESLPVILDDIFGMYEEEDLEAVLGWMYKEKKQVIISTCSKREMELLDREGIPYGKQIIS